MTEKVEATTTGKIWKVLTSVGAEVETDDVLGIIESMKMEIPITAPRAGKVTVVKMKEGDAVAEGQIVAEIE